MTPQDSKLQAETDEMVAQLTREWDLDVRSAEVVLDALGGFADHRTVLDVGCGLGAFMLAAERAGKQVVGVDSPWMPARLGPVNDKDTQAPKGRRVPWDLEYSLRDADLGRFDLVVCTEVAEHLPESAADTLVGSLCDSGATVLFSAAIPYQGGTHHVNEQFLPYWADKFAAKGYGLWDCVRPKVWNDTRVRWWLRQNLVLFMSGWWPMSRGMTSVVHPDVYLSRMRQAEADRENYAKLLTAVSEPGTFSSVRLADGRTEIRRLS